MNQQIQSMLKDLYALDPEFRKQETELVKVIESLLRSKPDARLDEDFIERLRMTLNARFETQAEKIGLFNRTRTENTPRTSSTLLKRGIFRESPPTEGQGWVSSYMNKLFYAVAGAALALIIAIPLAIKNNKLSIGTEEARNSFGLGPMGESLGREAFGNLSSGDGSSFSARNQSAPTLGRSESGGGGAGLGAGAGISSLSQDASASVSEKMIAPPMQNYTFSYTGDAYPFKEDSLEVLRREKGANSALGQILANMNLGLIDLKKFADGKLQNFTIVQDKEYGYVVYVDLSEGTIFVSQNWQRWPASTDARLDESTKRASLGGPQARCQDESCWVRYRVKPEELPSDQELIAIADKFLKDFGISTAGYGKPEVEKGFLRDYELMADKSMFFLDQIPVRYPLEVDGKPVYELQGEPAGLTVSIAAAERKATGVYGITTKNYSRSAYPAVKDFERVKKIAERGGMSSIYYYGREGQDGANKIELKLGNPEMVYARHFQYRDNQSIELLVPALRFPVENASVQGYYQKNVIVPLATEILDEWERNFAGDGSGDGPISIMPMTK